MNPLRILFSVALFWGASFAAAQNRVEVRNAWPSLVFPDCPVSVAFTREDPPRGIVALQRGLIHVLPGDRASTHAPVFLDFRPQLKEEIHFEAGLHSVVFDPDFARTRRVFLSYSQSNPRRNVLSVMEVPAGGFAADPSSERILMEIPHQLADHFSGSMAFGPDGMLYFSVGDGGLRDDPMRMAQHPFLLQGKILRLDVRTGKDDRPYLIPADNPFVGRQEWRGEIYALGFRNPWGLSFDSLTGELWAADVGQDRFEEVNRIIAGGNYGWSERDGTARLASREESKDPPLLPETPFIDPVHSYSRFDGEGICIVGGMVYRGSRLAGLHGCYLFADWGAGRIWSLRPGTEPGGIQPGPVPDVTLLHQPTEAGFNPVLIAPDANGEPLVLNHRGWIGELVERVGMGR
jgi:glucose/arabinose dehydrogenase